MGHDIRTGEEQKADYRSTLDQLTTRRQLTPQLAEPHHEWRDHHDAYAIR
jgi:hypothetical protein